MKLKYLLLLLFVQANVLLLAQPANNSCYSPTTLTPGISCTATAGNTTGATQSITGCTGVADDDVWYTFTATQANQTINVTPSSNFDPVVQLLTGACPTFTSVICHDDGAPGVTETMYASGLVPGNTYFVRVYDYRTGSGSGTFTICITSPPAPSNDSPCNAIALPAVNAACNYSTYSNVGATPSSGPGIPAPTSCVQSSSGNGGYNNSTLGYYTGDVWFTFVVPTTGTVVITPKPNQGAGWIQDGAMALYTGTCSSLTQIYCSDDDTILPSPSSNPGVNENLPYAQLNLTAGTTVYIRYWGYGSDFGNFSFCVSMATNDACSNALYICDINGYGGTTSNAYTPDRPSNMRGDNEGLGPGYADLTDGTSVSSGGYNAGIFGLGGSWGSGQPTTHAYDVIINNNSWVRFTAANTTATLNVSVSDCFKQRGIQMQIFSGTNCTNFAPVSNYEESTSAFIITANNLVIGQDYYLMIDGFAGDICSYTISANSGVQFPAITGVPAICSGATTTLTGPANASSYLWSPGGATTQSITVSPSSTTTYTCVAGGVCGYTQTLTKTITVNSLPVVAINSNNPVSVCNGSAVTLSASGANTYSWNTGASGASISVSPASNTTYTVTGTDANGCVNTGTVNVTVKALPPVIVNSPSVCYNTTATLNAGGAASYSWSTGASGTSSITVGPLTAAASSYTVTGTGANGCTNTAVSAVNVLPLPTISVNDPTICAGTNATLTANGGASSASYTWSDGSSNTNSISVSPAATTSYTVTGTGANGCTNTDISTVSVNQLPVVSSNNPTICSGSSATLTPAGALTYTWNGVPGNAISVNPSTTTSYTLSGTDNAGCTNTYTATVNVNQLPQVTTGATTTASACGMATGAISGIVVSGTNPLSYSWTNASNTQIATTLNVSNIPAGPYNLTIGDGNGCINTYSVSITNPGAPAAPLISANDTILCVGQQLVLAAASNASGPSFNWTGPGAISSSDTLSIDSVTVADNGAYAVTVTSANCTSSSTVVHVIVNPLPLANATNTGGTYCSGNTLTLQSSGGTSYSWSGPGSFSSSNQNISIANSTTAASGTYTVTVTDGNGCISSDTANVVINQTPGTVAPTASANPLCSGDSLRLFSSSTGGSTYSWTGPNSFSSSSQNPVIAPASILNAGTYTVTTSSSYGSQTCTSAQATIAVAVNPTPVASAAAGSAGVYCSGTTITLTANGGGSYSWSGPNSYSSSNTNDSISNSTVAANGTYTVTVSNGFGCSDTAQVAVLVNQSPGNPNATLLTNPVCEGDSVQLSASSAGGTAYTWTGPNFFFSALQNPVIPNAGTMNNGTYTVTASASFGGITCSSVNSTVNVNVNANPVAGATSTGNGFYCSGDSVKIIASGLGTYSWTGPNGFTDTGSVHAFNPISTSASGTYTVTVSNMAGCSDTATINLTINQTPAAAITTNDTTCNNGSLVLTATGNGVIDWYSDPSLNNLVLANNDSLIPLLGTNASATYYVTVSVNGCTSTAATAFAGNYNVQASASADVYTGNAPLTVNYTNQSTGVGPGDTYLWDFGNGSTATTYNASNVYNNGGTFTTELIVIQSVSGCRDTFSMSIYVEEGITFTIPNIFSPNGDNTNDLFTLNIKGAKEAQGIIYNRWGQVLYSWDALNSVWDGKASSGVAIPDGTYFYIIKLVGYEGEKKDIPGHVTIVR